MSFLAGLGRTVVYLLTCPSRIRDGTVVEDTHMRDSWAARATKVILQSGRKHGVPHAKEIEAARRKVQILSF